MQRKRFLGYKADIVWGLIFIICSLTLAFLLSTPAYSEDSIVWEKDDDLKSTGLSSITYGNSIYVAVGTEGVIKTSVDAVTWTSRASGVTENLYSVVWNGKLFVVGGLNSTILTSSDGITWVKRELGALKYQYTINNIIWDGNQFIATGGYASLGIILTSPDGITWTTRISETKGWVDKMAYNENIYVTVGYEGTIYTSTDTINWIPVHYDSIKEAFLYDIIWNGKLFAAVTTDGQVITSLDGKQWTSAKVCNGGLYSILWDNNQFVVYGREQVYVSTDAINWTIAATKKHIPFSSMIYHNGQYIAVSGANIMTSSDGVNWLSHTLGLMENLCGVAYNGSTFIMVGSSGTILSSADGNRWTSIDSGISGYLLDVLWNGEKFIAVGKSGLMIVSSDGMKWSQIPLATNKDIYKIISNGKILLGVGNSGVVIKSTDGLTWDVGSVKEDRYISFTDVIWNGTQFIAAGTSRIGKPYGLIATSFDGTDWIIKRVENSFEFYSIAWDGSKYIVAGDRLYTSKDTDTWENLSQTAMNDFSSIVWNGKMFVAVGLDSFGMILSSEDGTNWISHNSGTYSRLNKVAFLGNKFIVAGDYGNILTGTLAAPVKELPSFSGYVQPDISGLKDNDTLKEGFKVEVEGTDLWTVTNEKGYFSIPTISLDPFTQYTVKISKQGYLSLTTGYFAGGNYLYSTGKSPLTMWGGDIPINGVQDGAINMADIMEMAKYFNASTKDTSFKEYCDLNMDGAINMGDVVVIARLFNKTIKDYSSVELIKTPI